MPDKNEIERIALAMHDLRPEWRVDSLRSFLTKNHADRPFADLAIAAVAVTLDERTQTPQLLNQHGPWWVAAYQASRTPTPTVGPGAEPRCEKPGHEHQAARNCAACRSERIAVRDEEDAWHGPASTERPDLPLHRTWANVGVSCSTCDDGGCPDCTDPS